MFAWEIDGLQGNWALSECAFKATVDILSGVPHLLAPERHQLVRIEE